MKYHNIKVIENGIKFDSKKEAKRYWELKLCERIGRITNLELQKRYELQPSFKYEGKHERKIEYIADFYYYDNEFKCEVVEDVKSPATAKDKVYRLKKKMFKYKYPNIKFKEMI